MSAPATAILACGCGYADSRFCPKHGWTDPALGRVCLACACGGVRQHDTWCRILAVAVLACSEDHVPWTLGDDEAFPGDSLDKVSVVLAVEEKLGVEIPDVLTLSWSTPRVLAALAEASMPEIGARS